MKILQVVSGLGKASGVTTFVENVVSELRALAHTVDVCTCADPSALKSHTTPSSTLVPSSSLPNSSRSGNYDVVHIHGLWTPLLHRASVWAKRRGIPVVWSTHGMTAPWSLRHKWWKKCLPWHIYQEWDLRRAVLVHSTVELEAKWNADLGFTRGFIAPLGTSLPNSDIQAFSDSGIHTLLFVGRVYPVKALDRLIEGFSRVEVERRRNWRLRIVGPDQAGHMAELVALCTRLGLSYATPTMDGEPLSPLIEFVDPRFDAELAAEYASCDCLALVSHTENFGATVVDAMAHGKPVITSTNTPWQEVAERKCGWWVDNAPDVLAKTLREMMSFSDEARAEMGARGRQLVEEKYTWRAVAERLVVAYQQVLATPG